MKLLLSAALAVAALAVPAIARDREAVPDATPIGKPVDCVQPSRIDHTNVHGDSVIDFFMRGGKVYRNVLPQSCPSLGFEERYSYKTSIDQLCSVDLITVLESPGLTRGATCGLGQFQEVQITKIPAHR